MCGMVRASKAGGPSLHAQHSASMDLRSAQQRTHSRRTLSSSSSSARRRRPLTTAALVLPEAVLALSAEPGWNYACAAAAAVGAFVWVQLFKSLAAAGVMDQKLSRKLVHTTAGPLFVLTWPLFR